MPLYGFICEACDEDFEELVMSDAQIDQMACPACQSDKVHKKISLVASIGRSSTSGFSASSADCGPVG